MVTIPTAVGEHPDESSLGQTPRPLARLAPPRNAKFRSFVATYTGGQFNPSVARISGAVLLVCDGFAPLGDAVASVGVPVALVGDAVSCVSISVALVGGMVAPVRGLVTYVGVAFSPIDA